MLPKPIKAIGRWSNGKREILFLILLIFVFIKIAKGALYEGHNWGDDFGAYLHLAKNFNLGRPWLHNYSGVDAPPGFPILLAYWMRIFGSSFIALKVINIIAWAGTSLAAYFIARIYLGRLLSFIIGVLVLVVPFYYFYQQNIVTDVPATFFGTLAIYHFIMLNRNLYLSQAGFGISFHLAFSIFWTLISLLMRPASISIAVAGIAGIGLTKIFVMTRLFPFHKNGYLIKEFASQASVKSNLKVVVFSLAILAVSIAGYFLFFGESSSDHMANASIDFSEIGALFEQIKKKSKIEITNLTTLLFGYGLPKIAFVLTPLLIFLGALGYYIKNGDVVLPLVVAVNIAMLLVTPWENGPRYHFIATVPTIVFAVTLFKIIFDNVTRNQSHSILKFSAVALLVGLSFLPISQMIKSSVAGLNFNDEEINKPDAVATLNWLRENTADNDRICSFKPRAFMYLTDRPSCWLSGHQVPDEIGPYLRRFGARYAVLTRQRGYDSSKTTINQLSQDATIVVVFNTLDYVIVELVDAQSGNKRQTHQWVTGETPITSIVATGKKNPLAGSSEVWMRDILMEGLGSMSQLGDLNLIGDGFTKKYNNYMSSPNYSPQPTQVDIDLKPGRYELIFRTHPDSGIVRVEHGSEVFEVDLYSKVNDTKIVPLKISPVNKSVLDE